MKHTLPSDKDTVEKLNAFYIYKNAGEERVREILPHQAGFCQSNSNKTYNELRSELLRPANLNSNR